jgi:hypothetical protein
VPQYFGAGVVGAAPLALHDDLPLVAGAGVAPPPALHELFPPAADGSVGGAEAPPPHATVEPMSIPATADTARAFAMFISVVSSLLSRGASLFSGVSAPASVKRTRQG